MKGLITREKSPVQKRLGYYPAHGPRPAHDPPRPRKRNPGPQARPPAAPGPEPRPTLNDEYMTVEELAAALRLSPMTAYRHVSAGRIPGALRIGRTIRIPVTSAEAYLKACLITQPPPGSGQPGQDPPAALPRAPARQPPAPAPEAPKRSPAQAGCQ
jgi:excisionase family DNA binding protein